MQLRSPGTSFCCSANNFAAARRSALLNIAQSAKIASIDAELTKRNKEAPGNTIP
jgi:hypothetical protein